MRLLTIIITLLTSTSLFAQKFDAGFIGGFTASQISGDELRGFDKGGARLGTYIQYPLKKNLNGQIEMQYLQKGSRAPSDKNYNYKLNLHYLEIPITLNYKLVNGLVLESGIGTGVLFSYSERDEIGELGGEKPNLLGIDFLFGFQYQIMAHTKLNIRYGNSIIPIRTDLNTNLLDKNNNWYSSLVSFALMYQISR